MHSFDAARKRGRKSKDKIVNGKLMKSEGRSKSRKTLSRSKSRSISAKAENKKIVIPQAVKKPMTT